MYVCMVDKLTNLVYSLKAIKHISEYYTCSLSYRQAERKSFVWLRIARLHRRYEMGFPFNGKDLLLKINIIANLNNIE